MTIPTNSDDAAKIRVSEYPTSTTGQSVVIEREGRRTQGAAQVTTDDLIARLEAAEGPSRELDAEIAQIHGWEEGHVANERCWYDPDGRMRAAPPAYTSSIDAALTLVPEGRLWTLGQYVNRSGFMAALDNQRGTKAATAPLALCIASLKARTQGDGDE